VKIVTLLENTSSVPTLTGKHGISLYIETDTKTILFDTGPDQTFLDNAVKLNIDLATVDLLIISHGHYDHGGGITEFLKLNQKARIIFKDSAVNQFYSRSSSGSSNSIGLNTEDIDLNRCQLITENYQINEQIRIFTNFRKSGFIPDGNKNLFTKDQFGKLVNDNFKHEICLLIQANHKKILFTGCSHSGLGNMINSVKSDTGIKNIDYVIGGFHLYNPVSKRTESTATIDMLLAELGNSSETIFYTGHCTGASAFQYLKATLKERVKKFQTGTIIEI